MERRKHPRKPVQCPISFKGDHIVGECTSSNLSMGGCKVVSDKLVYVGTILEMQIHLPGQKSPLEVDEAVVRWLIGREIGVEFLRMRGEEQDRLARFLKTLPTESRP